ncbi:MAG: hypothetical protein J5594_03540 [Elusimicrobiaceae bacterium]|nr:hypothetical protein [Elusimicrobiaceae bacterium]
MIKNLKAFNLEFNEQIKLFSSQIKDFKTLEDRFDKILVQKKRKFEVRDTGFEQDFLNFALNLQKFAFNVYDAMQELRFNSLKIFPNEETLTLKELAISCEVFNNNIRKFDSLFKTLDPQIPAASLNLRWGIIDIAHKDFLNLEKQLTSLIKEVRKYYE